MANRSGNDYRFYIGLETALNSGYTSSDSVIDWEKLVPLQVESSDFTPDRQVIETNFKTGTMQTTGEEKCLGYKDGTGTFQGLLSYDYEELLRAVHHKTSTPYEPTDSQPASTRSYIVLRVWDKGSGSNYTVDIATGCRFDPLVINGTTMNAIDFTASFRMCDYKENATVAITGTDPGIYFPSCKSMFQFGDVTLEINKGVGETTRPLSFTVTIGPEYASDEHVWANSQVRTKDLINKWEGSLQYSSLWDSETSFDAMEDIAVKSTEEGQLALNCEAGRWSINFGGRISAYSAPDPGKDRFTTDATVDFTYNNPIGTSWTVAVVSS